MGLYGNVPQYKSKRGIKAKRKVYNRSLEKVKSNTEDIVIKHINLEEKFKQKYKR